MRKYGLLECGEGVREEEFRYRVFEDLTRGKKKWLGVGM